MSDDKPAQPNGDGEAAVKVNDLEALFPEFPLRPYAALKKLELLIAAARKAETGPVEERARRFAQRCDPFEPGSETTTGTCVAWRESVAQEFQAYIEHGAAPADLSELVGEISQILSLMMPFHEYESTKAARKIVDHVVRYLR
jgi:hypothetical protein